MRTLAHTHARPHTPAHARTRYCGWDPTSLPLTTAPVASGGYSDLHGSQSGTRKLYMPYSHTSISIRYGGTGEDWSPTSPAARLSEPKLLAMIPIVTQLCEANRSREQVPHPGGSRHGHAPGSLHLFGSCRRTSRGGGSSPIGVRLTFLFAALEGVHQWLVVGSWLCPVLGRTVRSGAMAPNPDGGLQPPITAAHTRQLSSRG